MASPFVAKDGSKHTNRDTMKRSDARFGGGASKSMAQPGYGASDDVEGDGSAGGEQAQDGTAMAQEHGPAVETVVNHEGGAHSVHATHPDGHTHESQHGSAEEAHKFAADCAGAGSGGGMGGEM